MPSSDGFALEALQGLIGPTGKFCTLHLYKNNVVPVPSSTPASFTEADFDDYHPLTSDQWTMTLTDDGLAALAKSPWFQVSKGPDLSRGQSIYGLWVGMSGPRTTVEQYCDGFRFDPPAPMRKAGATLRFRVDVAAGRDGVEGTNNLIFGAAITLSYETFRARGLFRGRARGLSRAIQALIDDDGRRQDNSAFDGGYYNSVFVDEQSDVAGSITLARVLDLLSR